MLTFVCSFLKLKIKTLFQKGKKYISFKIRIQKRISVFCGKKSELCIGNHVSIRNDCELRAENGGKIIIEDRTFINRNTMIISHESIKIGRGTKIGPNVMIYDHDHNFRHVEGKSYITAPIEIGKNVWIGAGVIILKGVKIGDNAVISAGTIVTKDIPANHIIYNKILREEKLII